MNAYEIILKKRDGHELFEEEIVYFINEFTAGVIPQYQMSALAMAIYFQNMTFKETAYLTKVMLESGKQLNLDSIDGIKVDKHSTGGVGDKVSIPLIAIVAAAGIPVPMIAGRGLGHTGGTIDKLEAIPGFRTDLTEEEFIESIKKINACLIGQTKDIAPADKKLYALRDVTATVPSIPLITASIMSKKLAEGANAFTLDVKYGSGAFMKTVEDATILAESLVQTGHLQGRSMIAYLTNMNQPLGLKIGNWLEIEESIDILKGCGPKDITDLTLIFAGTMIYQGGKATTIVEGIQIAKFCIESGDAYEKFCELVILQGGDTSHFEDYKSFRDVKHVIEIRAEKDGYIKSIDALELGLISVAIGGGRQNTDDIIDPHVGIEIFHKVGDSVNIGDILAKLYLNKNSNDEIILRTKSAFIISNEPVKALPLIAKMISEKGELPFENILSAI